MIEESIGAVENQFVFGCDSCCARSRVYHGPAMTLEHATERVRSRKWQGKGQDWTCPVCRVSSLQAEQFDEVCALAVPSDLSEDLANHFADYDLDCGLKRPVLADKDFLLFAKEINPARIEAVLKKWDGSPLLPRQKP